MLRTLQALREKIASGWTAATPGAKWSYALAISAVVAVVAGVGYWSSQPQYVALVQGRPPADVAQVVSQLESQGIPYRLDFAGSTVLVPKNQHSQARVAAGDHLDPLASDAKSDVDPGLFSDPSLNQHRLLQAKELELERSLLRVKAIAGADVHIAKPIPSPFARERQPATASVVLQLRSDQHLSRHQAGAVAAMVAGAVEGLTADAVTITDVFGNMLWSNAVQGSGEVMERAEYQRQVEQDLVAKAETLLEETLGPGKAVVRVTASIDFNNRKMRETTYDPQAKVKKSEKTRTTKKEPAKGISAGLGVAGASGNQAGTGLSSAGGAVPVSENEEEFETEYVNPHVESEVTEAAGTVKRLTVAAMVDLSGDSAAADPATAAGGNGTPAGNTQPAVTKEQVERIIKTAVGFDIERNDQIEVMVTQLRGPDLEPLATAFPWEQYALFVRHGSLGIAALVALVLGVMIIRTFSQAISRMPERGAVKSDAMRDFAMQAQRNPEVVSKILAAWLSRTEAETSGPATVPFDAASRPAAAAPKAAA